LLDHEHLQLRPRFQLDCYLAQQEIWTEMVCNVELIARFDDQKSCSGIRMPAVNSLTELRALDEIAIMERI
jgi:hypothetical protein